MLYFYPVAIELVWRFNLRLDLPTRKLQARIINTGNHHKLIILSKFVFLRQSLFTPLKQLGSRKPLIPPNHSTLRDQSDMLGCLTAEFKSICDFCHHHVE